MQLSGQRGGKVETKTVDVHLGDPVAEAVHDQLQHVRVAHVQAVPGPGVVHVEPAILGDRAVVRPVVDAPHRQHRAEVVPFGGVVVHNIQDDLDACPVKRLDHGLELSGDTLGIAVVGILVVGGEIGY